jgi:hypothetical protein
MACDYTNSAGTVYCEWLTTNFVNDCNDTYSDCVGGSFDTFHIGFAVMSIIVSIVHFIIVYKTVKSKDKGWRPVDTQLKLFYLCVIVCIGLLVRSVDPFGWRRWLPYVVVGLAYDWGTAALYSVIIILVRDWLTVLMKISGRGEREGLIKKTSLGIIIFTWLQWTITSILQSLVDPQWLFRSIKLIFGAIILLVLMAMLYHHGRVIYGVLADNEKMLQSGRTSASASKENLEEEEPNSARAYRSNSRASQMVRENSKTGTSRNRSQTQTARRQSSKINRIVRVLKYTGTVVVLAVIFQVFISYSAISAAYTIKEPDSPPEGLGAAFVEGSFDILHAASVLAVDFFFFHGANPKKDGADSRRSSRSFNSRSNSRSNNDDKPEINMSYGKGRTRTATASQSDIQMQETV